MRRQRVHEKRVHEKRVENVFMKSPFFLEFVHGGVEQACFSSVDILRKVLKYDTEVQDLLVFENMNEYTSFLDVPAYDNLSIEYGLNRVRWIHHIRCKIEDYKNNFIFICPSSLNAYVEVLSENQ